MQRASSVVGRTVVSATSGENLGRVVDLLLDANANRLVGLVLGRGLLASELVLPFEAVETLGRDAVIARSSEPMDAAAWRTEGVSPVRSQDLKHRAVLTSGGRRIGEIKDVCLDERSGAVESYDVAGPAFAGLIQRRALVASSDEVTVGPDAVVVPDSAWRRLESEAAPDPAGPADAREDR